VIERSGALVETEFKIKATAKAFSILSSGLYANKIRAIIRELSCNAYDSHVAAKKTDVPIEIHLPTMLDPTFYVKDFGVGLDHEGVTQLYTTYFESTKSDSNDYIGALGLGSKSPFSYTESFQVESRFEGMKRFYTAFINESGTPAITKIAEQKTDEPNGLTVSLQVKKDDIAAFETEAKHALMYFSPLPKVLGKKNFETHGLRHTITGNEWKIRESDYYAFMNGPYVLQGFVAYPINVDVLRQQKLSEAAQAILELNIDIIVQMGEVEVAASREALSYNKHTIANLVRRVEAIGSDMYDSVQAEFNRCTNLWSARMKYMAFRKETNQNTSLMLMFRRLCEKKPFTWQGKNLDDDLKLDVGTVDNVEIVMYYKTRSNKALQRSFVYEPGTKSKHFDDKQKTFGFELELHPDLPVLIDDLYGGNDIIRQWLEERINKAGKDSKYALVLRPLSRKVEMEAKQEIGNILAELGGPNALLVSKLGFERTKKSYYKKRATNLLYVWAGFATNGGYRKNQVRRTFSKNCWRTKQIDLADGGLYLPVDRFAVMHNGKEQEYIDEMLSTAVALNILSQQQVDSELVALNEKELVKAQEEGTWTNAITFIETEFAKLNQNHALTNTVVAADLLDKLGRGMSQSIIVPWKRLRDKVVDCDFKTLIDTVIGYAANKTEHRLVNKAIDHFKFADERQYIIDTVDAVMAQWKSVKSQYEMFDLINWGGLHVGNVQIVIDYINMQEKLRQKS
jgi:DNA-binding transcriptional ArsR family regulator